MDELISVVDAVSRAMPVLAQRGVEVCSVGIGGGNQVVVGLAELRKDWIAAIDSMFPEANLAYRQQERLYLA